MADDQVEVEVVAESPAGTPHVRVTAKVTRPTVPVAPTSGTAAPAASATPASHPAPHGGSGASQPGTPTGPQNGAALPQSRATSAGATGANQAPTGTGSKPSTQPHAGTTGPTGSTTDPTKSTDPSKMFDPSTIASTVQQAATSALSLPMSLLSSLTSPLSSLASGLSQVAGAPSSMPGASAFNNLLGTYGEGSPVTSNGRTGLNQPISSLQSANSTSAGNWAGNAQNGYSNTNTTAQNNAAGLAAVDAELNSALASSAQNTATGKQKVQSIIDSVNAKITSLGPAANTPAGQAAILAVLHQGLSEAGTTVSQSAVQSVDNAAYVKKLTAQYAVAAASSTADSTTGSAKQLAILNAARAQLGKPYVWGATGPDSFDCSGLTQYAYKQAGVNIPRTSQQQYNASHAVSTVQAGDLVFSNFGSGGPGHVAIAISPTQVIEAQQTGVPIKISSIPTDAVVRRP